jgi:hypothetical protein
MLYEARVVLIVVPRPAAQHPFVAGGKRVSKPEPLYDDTLKFSARPSLPSDNQKTELQRFIAQWTRGQRFTKKEDTKRLENRSCRHGYSDSLDRGEKRSPCIEGRTTTHRATPVD